VIAIVALIASSLIVVYSSSHSFVRELMEIEMTSGQSLPHCSFEIPQIILLE
jgi:hypothetical protein